MNNKINILHLIPELNLTCGISRTINDIIKKSSNRYYHIVLTLNGDAIEKFSQEGIKVIDLKYKSNQYIFSVQIFLKIVRIISKYKIDIAHNHHRYFDILLSLIQKISKVKTVTSVQSIVKGYRQISYQSKLLIAASSSVRKHLIEYFGIHKNRINIINNFVNDDDISLDKTVNEIRDEIGIKMNERIILFMGRFDKEKGVDILIKSFIEISHIYENIILLLVGTGNLQQFLEQVISTYKLNAKIIAPSNNPFQFYKIADFVVLPSRVDPFPLVMLEVGYMQKGFIGSSVDGIAEFVEDGINGILVKPENVSELTNAMKLLLENNELLNKYGTHLHQKVLKNFTQNSIIPKYEHVYLTL